MFNGRWTHIVTIKYLEIGKRMLNERERVLFQGDNHNLRVRGEGDTTFLPSNVWDFNITSTMNYKNNSYHSLSHGKVNISIECCVAEGLPL